MMKSIFAASLIAAISLSASADPNHLDGRADLRLTKNNNLHMGVVDLGEAGERNQAGGEAKADLDIIKLPECRNTENRPVTALRFVVPKKKLHGADRGQDNKIAYIESFTVIYDNGAAEEIRVRQVFNNVTSAEGSKWYDLNRHRRCVRVVAVNGEEFERNIGKRSTSEVHVIGQRLTKAKKPMMRPKPPRPEPFKYRGYPQNR